MWPRRAAFALSDESKLVEPKSAHVEIRVVAILFEVRDYARGRSRAAIRISYVPDRAGSIGASAGFHVGLGALPQSWRDRPRGHGSREYHAGRGQRLHWFGGPELHGDVGATANAATPPTCEVSPPSRTPPGGASVTITSSSSGTPTTPLLYNITVTGTSSGITHSSSQDLTILAVVPTFTITVQTTVVPSSVPAGQGGQGLISVNPVNGYSGNVTLSCATLTPLVSIPPYCTFTYPPGKSSLPVMNGVPSTSTVTITSFGPTTVMCANTHRWTFYALWLPLPLLTLVGFGRKRRKAWAVLGLFVMTGIFLLMPACGNTVTTTCTPNGVTPANSYSLTVTGVDENGNISSNTGSTTTNPTISLTVTAPKN